MRRHAPKMAAKEENDLSTVELTEGKGEQAFQQVLSTAIKLPGVRIDRETFLRRELSKYCSADIVEAALMKNPAQAQIDQKIIDQIANSCISNETTRVTALSTAAGLPGGLAMVGTVPADLVQYFGHILRILQKLAYLYGWQNLLDGNAGDLDDATTNLLTLFIGVMFGAQGAGKAIAKVSQTAAVSLERRLLNTALTKGTIYPLVKKVMQALGIRITTKTFSTTVPKAIPIVGGILSGGITLATFLPMSKKLQNYLKTLPMSSTDYYRKKKKNRPQAPSQPIDVDFQEEP